MKRYGEESEKMAIKEQNKDFLFQSKEEFDTYKRTGNINRFRQGSNKLFAITENIVEAKTGKFFEKYNEFSRAFKHTKFKEFKDYNEKLDFIIKLKASHSFYYHGIEEATDIEALENTYREVHSKLKLMV